MRTEAGARRYGVAVGEVYYGEAASGTIEKGQKGSRTRDAQDALAKAGWLPENSGRNRGRDGLFGPKTEAAVKAFQKAVGLPVTGKLDDTTAKRLLDVAPDGDPPAGKVRSSTSSSAKDAPDPAKGRAPGEPKPDGTRATADKIVAARHRAFGTQPVRPRSGAKRVEEDEVPAKSSGGAALIDYTDGAGIYADGSVYDGLGWQPGKPAKRRTTQRKALLDSELERAARVRQPRPPRSPAVPAPPLVIVGS